MAAITICSDFGAQKNKVNHCFHCFPHLFAMKWWVQMLWSYFSECWVFRQLFHFLLSLSSRGSTILLHFLHKGGVICISEVIDISPSNLDSSLCSSSPAFLMMYSAYKLNKQGDNIQLWHTLFPIWNQSVVPCPVLTVASWMHKDFSRGRSGGLVFPCLEVFSTVCCDPQSQRLWHSQ